MAKDRLYRHVHPFKAFFYIGLSIFCSLWLVSSAHPNSAKADDEISLSDLLSQKDYATKSELAKPNVILDVNVEPNPETVIDMPFVPKVIDGMSIVISPKDKHQSVKSPITIIGSLNFNPTMIQQAFNITPNVSGSMRVNGQVAIFTPDAPLAPQTKYEVVISPAELGQNGEKLNEKVSVTFETRPDVKILPVPFYRQQYDRSCEAASLRMALAYQGVVTDDMEIVKSAGYNPREPDYAKRIWDNPYEMFVGFIEGKRVGYGMYAQALSKAATELGRKNSVLKNPTVEDIAKEVSAGNPVIVWGYISGTVPKLSYFTTNDGTRIPIYSNEHARTVVGIVGNAEDPVGFYIHDPLSGKANEYWTKEVLEKHMNIFGSISNQALVVYAE